MREEWRVIEESPTYLVSNKGRVKNPGTGRILKPSISGKYPKVNLIIGNGYATRAIHRLVAKAFVPGEAPGLIVNHKDGNKLNAASTNLEWITQDENIQHAVREGLIRKTRAWVHNPKTGKMKEIDKSELRQWERR